MYYNVVPNDPIILLSFLNTKLRDNYPSFDELCKSLNIDKQEISAKLASIGYVYNKNLNRFK